MKCNETTIGQKFFKAALRFATAPNNSSKLRVSLRRKFVIPLTSNYCPRNSIMQQHINIGPSSSEFTPDFCIWLTAGRRLAVLTSRQGLHLLRIRRFLSDWCVCPAARTVHFRPSMTSAALATRRRRRHLTTTRQRPLTSVERDEDQRPQLVHARWRLWRCPHGV